MLVEWHDRKVYLFYSFFLNLYDAWFLLFSYPKKSLLATIRQVRPDLVTNKPLPPEALPIPAEMPPEFTKKHKFDVEGVGQPITACFLTQTSTDPTNW